MIPSFVGLIVGTLDGSRVGWSDGNPVGNAVGMEEMSMGGVEAWYSAEQYTSNVRFFPQSA
jgi:hypothetical protein